MEFQFHISDLNLPLYKIKMCSATNNKNLIQLCLKVRFFFYLKSKIQTNRTTTKLIERLNIKDTVSFKLFALPVSSYSSFQTDCPYSSTIILSSNLTEKLMVLMLCFFIRVKKLCQIVSIKFPVESHWPKLKHLL